MPCVDWRILVEECITKITKTKIWFIVGKLEGGGSVAVAVGIGDR